MAEVLLPWVFILGAAMGGVFALAALWLSLRFAFTDPTLEQSNAAMTTEARAALLTEKDALLDELRDIAFEHDAGKLSDLDYEEINSKLRAQARKVLEELDAGADAYRDEAESLIAERIGEGAKGEV